MAAISSSLILCDAHVHIHDCFDLDDFLDSAWINFRSVAELQGKSTGFSPALLLTESMGDNWFGRLTDAALGQKDLGSRWQYRATGEAESVLAIHCNGHEILIVAGRQIVTMENLEVSALITIAECPDGEPIIDVVDWVLRVGGIPVIPWGLGKWWGARAKVLSELLSSVPPNRLFLGDNGGRPWILGTPRHFLFALTQCRRILPGSDPLPFQWESSRPGSVGFSYIGVLEDTAPARGVRSQLLDANAQIGTYMRCQRLLPFFRNQAAMQIRKRFR